MIPRRGGGAHLVPLPMRRLLAFLVVVVLAVVAGTLPARRLAAQQPQVEACLHAPTSLRLVAPVTAVDTLPLALRRDDVFVVQGTRCVALVTLGDDARFLVKWHPCITGQPWRAHAVTYSNRSSAIDRARRVPPCVSTSNRS